MTALTGLGLCYVVKVDKHSEVEIKLGLKTAQQVVIVAESRCQVSPKCILQ